VVLLLSVWFVSAVVASSVASRTKPGPPPTGRKESAKDVANHDPRFDEANLTLDLFGVQHGPRWARAICTTRSTASKKEPRWRRSRRRPIATARPSGAGSRSHSPNDSDVVQPPKNVEAKFAEIHDMNCDIDAMLSTSTSNGNASNIDDLGDPCAFRDRFQRAFLASGQMHTVHCEHLFLLVTTTVVISVSLLYTLHWRRAWTGDVMRLHERYTPLTLFEAYGSPFSLSRGIEILMAFAFAWILGERLYGVASVANVAALSLRQRRRAVAFLKKSLPCINCIEGDELRNLEQAIAWVEEYTKCCDFALELSALRWVVLRTPVLLALMFAFKALVGAVVCAVFRDVVPEMLDPVMGMCLAACVAWSLAICLDAAARSNAEVRSLSDDIVHRTEHVLDRKPSMQTGGQADVLYVHLRVKAAEALRHSYVCWPGGRRLGWLEPIALLLVSSVAFACVVVL